MKKQRVLIVEDEENIRTTMQFALEAAGYAAETAADGGEALRLFGTGEGWDLVLLDQRMPGMEGLEVLRRLRERDPGARVVMATAYGTIELAVDAMKAGAIDFLRKPFTPNVLRGTVRTALSHPRLRPDLPEADLTHLLPTVPAPREPDLPLIHFRTLNGYRFWPVPLPTGGEETEALRIRRAFEVMSPGGERRQCAVEVTTTVRALVRDVAGYEHAPDAAVWDTVCKMALSTHLWEKAEFPPEALPVYALNREQLEVVRAFSGQVAHHRMG